MITRISKLFRQNEAGFTLVEMIVVIALIGIVATGASAGIYHLLSVNATSANTVTVTKNVESALHYLERDVQMSQSIGESGTEWLWLEWTWDDGDHRVAYEIEGDKLFRIYTFPDSTETRAMVAEYINADLTEWQLLSGGSNEVIVEITISASIDGYKPASETRTVQVVQRVTP